MGHELHQRHPAEDVDLTTYLPSLAGITQSYHRQELSAVPHPLPPYEKKHETWGRAEGSLIGARRVPMKAYLRPLPQHFWRPLFPWPYENTKTESAFFLVFHPPMIEWPASLPTTGQRTDHSQVQSYDLRGFAYLPGTATRTWEFQGFEKLSLQGLALPRSAVIRCETTMTFGILFHVVIVERVWLAKGLGVVRRQEKFSCAILHVIPLQSKYSYELSRGSIQEIQGTVLEHATSVWSHVAIHLDRVIPRPRVAGISAEFVP